MSVAIDIVERMFEYGGMLYSAETGDPEGYPAGYPRGTDDYGIELSYDPDTARPPAPNRFSATPLAATPFAPGASATGELTGAFTSGELTGETVRDLQSRIRQMQGTRLDTKLLPTHPALAALLPGGALKQGAAYSVEHSATLLMALLAGPSAAGSWCGVVGVPEFGVEAASHYGIDLERLVLVPHPGDQWLAVTAAIADVLTVVVTRPPKQATDASVARLAARLRQRGSTLIVLGPWPQTDAMLSLSHSTWSGIGDGFGHLAAREVTVTVSTRAGGRPRSARLWLPDRTTQIRRSESPRTTGGIHQQPTEHSRHEHLSHEHLPHEHLPHEYLPHEYRTELAG